ncbi:hypothetical protein W97_05306 [Coniosporium apollinis CBS 100218]|uniref:Cyclin-domain-containing protein n=1 Tax=Coniosporium apollinis (strain CBS 100218) TaxID=1168221 RepID=R7YW40_CONA1|nr:uncharacterized protein W97_05306 [Coniosporium apollinis CBS 100218]EON66063.1 hypothetical protein W97_05306 [Coniosporium apollinis CBS 100218]
MEQSSETRGATSPSQAGTEPPSPPNPSADTGVIPPIRSPNRDAPSPPAEGQWVVSDIAPETAMKMFCRSLQALALVSGDIPPTPPISRPGTPRSRQAWIEGRVRSTSRPATPVPSHDIEAPSFRDVVVGSPEAHMSEPFPGDIGADAEPERVQQQAIARRFFSKRPANVALNDYLIRLQRYCPMSTAVWLAAGVYIYKLSVVEKLVPITNRTLHRLVLASLRVAMKALEDLRYHHERFAGVGGVSVRELKVLEISLCYLLDFDLQVNSETLYSKNLSLQKAAQRAVAFAGKTPASFQPRLPTRTASSATATTSA